MIKSTNNLTPQLMFGDGGFEDWLVRLEPFHNDKHNEPMSANQFYWGARIQYGCALRISELLKLIRDDFDLDHRILTVRSPKSNKSGIQKTTIMPYDIVGLDRFISKFDGAERLFPTTRSTMWRYYKNASILGGLPLFEAKEQINIEGAWTHLMRSSCAKLYEDFGAKHSIVQRKMRHSFKDVTDRYTKADLNAVLDFDDIHFREIPIRNEVLQ